jgi:hypothetical protein
MTGPFSNDVQKDIVQALSSGFPLTAERTYCIIKNRSRAPTTYGRVYREMELLRRRGIIIRSEDGYVLKKLAKKMAA